MIYTPRYYQADAIGAGIDYFRDKKKNYNGLLIEPTGAGKSLIIANIAKELQGKTGILQPSAEILAQNYNKFTSYGYRATVYSASAGIKYVDDVTFATIGSIAKKPYLFSKFKNWIIDECHLVNPKEGMYHSFIKAIPGVKVLGLTASPYRLASYMEGTMLKFITRSSPRIFNKVLHFTQTAELFERGYLAPLEYYKFNVIDRSMLKVNSSGSGFTDQSVAEYYRRINFPSITIEYANRILLKRKNLLVFCSTIDEALKVCAGVPGSAVLSDKTPDAIRSRIISEFRSGKISCIINVRILGVGFDFPELEACLLAFSTMSLAKYYQCIGRIMRPFTYPDGSVKTGWVVDLGGNVMKFGRIETMRIIQDIKGLYSIWNDGRQLTNVMFTA